MNTDVLRHIKANFVYDPLSGVISKAIGGVGCVYQDSGYLRLAFDLHGKQYKPMAHRAAWFLHFGEVPPKDIDHADGDRKNNKISNLRLATMQENMRNTACKRNSKSQIKGVRLAPSGRYQARITVDKHEIYLGTFDSADEARLAFVEIASGIHGQFLHKSLAECDGVAREPASKFHA